MRIFRKAQNIGEYAIVMAIIGAALVAMQTYLTRSVQGLVKLSVDEIGQQEIESFDITQSAMLFYEAEDTQDDKSHTVVNKDGKRIRNRTTSVKPIGSNRTSYSLSGSSLADMSQ